MGWFRAPSTGSTPPDYTGLQLQTSVNTLPVAIVWGESKIAANVVWYSNFQTQDGSSGGKGFLNSSPSETTYTADLILELCEGPIAGRVRSGEWSPRAVRGTPRPRLRMPG